MRRKAIYNITLNLTQDRLCVKAHVERVLVSSTVVFWRREF